MIAAFTFSRSHAYAISAAVIHPHQHEQRQQQPFIQCHQSAKCTKRRCYHRLRDKDVSPVVYGVLGLAPQLFNQGRGKDQYVYRAYQRKDAP